MFLRLCCRAPRTTRRSMGRRGELARAGRAAGAPRTRRRQRTSAVRGHARSRSRGSVIPQMPGSPLGWPRAGHERIARRGEREDQELSSKAIGAGAVLGAIALVAVRACMAPARRAAPAATLPDRRDRRRPPCARSRCAIPSATARLPPSRGPLAFAADPALARPRARRSMALVDGDFCPALRTTCVRPSGRRRLRRVRAAASAASSRPDPPALLHRSPRVAEPRRREPARVRRLVRGEGALRLARASASAAARSGSSPARGRSACRTRGASSASRARATSTAPRSPFDVEAMIDDAPARSELSRLWQADRIGSHPDCVSAFGAYDLSGNVDEWTDNLADDPCDAAPLDAERRLLGPGAQHVPAHDHGPRARRSSSTRWASAAAATPSTASPCRLPGRSSSARRRTERIESALGPSPLFS